MGEGVRASTMRGWGEGMVEKPCNAERSPSDCHVGGGGNVRIKRGHLTTAGKFGRLGKNQKRKGEVHQMESGVIPWK